jgi:hypothetical protein
VEYRVAADDNAGAICHRFARHWWQLTDSDGTLLGTYPDLTIGELVVLTNASKPNDSAQYGNNPVC